MGMSRFSYIGLPQMEPTFITDEIFITPGSGCNKHLKIKGTRKLLFQNNRLYFQNKSKSSLILRRFYATLALNTNAWFKMLLPIPGTLSRLGPSYYTCAFYRRCPFSHGTCLNKQNLGKNLNHSSTTPFIRKCSRLCKSIL